MKIKVLKSKLLDGLKDVQSGANAKAAVDVYGNVKVEAKDGKLSLTTTNGELTLFAQLDCEVEDSGATTLPMRLFFGCIAVLPEGEVVIEGTNDKFNVKSGSSRFVMNGIAAEKFPQLPSKKVEHTYTVKADVLGGMLRKTSYAQSVDETRRTLSSVLLDISADTIRCVATDGKRLAVADAQMENVGDAKQFILPPSTVAIVQKQCSRGGEIVIEDMGSQVVFTMCDGAFKVYSRVIEGVYPNYAQVIPQNQTITVVIDREALIGAVERVSVMSMLQAQEPSVKMTFANNRIIVRVVGGDNGVGTDEIPVKYDGEKVEIMFNPRYVLDPLKASVTDEISFGMTDGAKAATIKVQEEKFLCVLMPLRQS